MINLTSTYFKEIAKEIKLKRSKDLTAFNVILNFPIKWIQLRITYMDLKYGVGESIDITSHSLSGFKKKLQEYVPEHDFFTRIYLDVEFYHHWAGDRRGTDVIIDDGSEYYESKELHRFTNPIVEFLDDHPELLI